MLGIGVFALSSTLAMGQRTALHDHHVFHKAPASPSGGARAMSPGPVSHSVQKGPKAKPRAAS